VREERRAEHPGEELPRALPARRPEHPADRPEPSTIVVAKRTRPRNPPRTPSSTYWFVTSPSACPQCFVERVPMSAHSGKRRIAWSMRW
jgi:hypothetical protein